MGKPRRSLRLATALLRTVWGEIATSSAPSVRISHLRDDVDQPTGGVDLPLGADHPAVPGEFPAGEPGGQLAGRTPFLGARSPVDQRQVEERQVGVGKREADLREVHGVDRPFCIHGDPRYLLEHVFLAALGFADGEFFLHLEGLRPVSRLAGILDHDDTRFLGYAALPSSVGPSTRGGQEEAQHEHCHPGSRSLYFHSSLLLSIYTYPPLT